MANEQYRSIVFSSKEDRNIEFKASFPWRRSSHANTMAKVVKTILAMNNLRDSGHIVIGVAEDPNASGQYIREGIEDAHLVTFDHEQIADFARRFAEPFAQFDLRIVELDGKDYVVISIPGFSGIPVICKDSYGTVLSEGAVYVRSRTGRPRSEPVSNYGDMKDLIDMATEHGVVEHLRRRTRIEEEIGDDEESFDQQLGDI